MKSIVKYILLFCLVSGVACAGVPVKETNANKFSYKKQNAKAHSNNLKQVKQIKTREVYLQANHFNKNYLVKQILIKVEGIDFKENLEFIYKEYLEKYITNDDIMSLNKKITQYFIEQDYLLPQTTINEQDLEKGILNIKVKIESLTDVIIIGESNDLIQGYANKILKAQPTRVKATQRYLALMNKVPGFDVQYKLREDVQDELNKQASSIDLVITTSKMKGEAFVNADNYGSNSLGKAQGVVKAEIFSPFNDSDSLSFTGFTTNHVERLYDLGIDYSIPLNMEGTRANFSASHAQDNPTRNNPYVTAKDSYQDNFSLDVTHPLYLTASKELEVYLGVNYKTLNNYGLINLNTAAATDNSKYWSADLGLEYLFKDNFAGNNIIRTSFTQGLDGSFKNYQDPTDIADKHFNLASLDIYRQQNLVNNFSVFTHFSVKYSDKELPDQELFILGGREFGRGYSFCTIDGNKLAAMSFELRYTKDIEHKILRQLEPYIFIDNGYVGKQASSTNITNLTSAGAGMRYKLYNDIEISTEVAQPFKRNYTVDGEKDTAGTRFNMFINKIFKF